MAAFAANLFAPNAMRLLLLWLINAASLLAVAHFLPSITVASLTSALIAAVVLGLVNTLIRPVLVLLTFPVTILTLGVFILVINGLLFWLVGSILAGFVVTDFWGVASGVPWPTA
jgi:putative membrane protein